MYVYIYIYNNHDNHNNHKHKHKHNDNTTNSYLALSRHCHLLSLAAWPGGRCAFIGRIPDQTRLMRPD